MKLVLVSNASDAGADDFDLNRLLAQAAPIDQIRIGIEQAKVAGKS